MSVRKKDPRTSIATNPSVTKSEELTVICISGARDVDERIVEIVIDQTILELLDEIQNSTVEFSWWPSVIIKGLLILYITV